MSDDLFDETLISSTPADAEESSSIAEMNPGEMLGKFEVVKELGRGGMGAVYLARDPTLDRNVAIKVLAKSFSQDQSALQRFLAEARAAGQLNHPNVVGVYEVGQRDEGDYFIAMEYLPNGSVADKLKSGIPCDSVWATSVILDTAKGLAAAHHVELIHRDIKPANLMIGDGTTKVADFGLVRSQKVEDAHVTQAGQIIGTPYYMSPEQCVGRSVDARSDIYSLGATYYTLLGGTSPFANAGSTMEIIAAHVNQLAPDLSSINPGVPDACVRIANRALEKTPEDRYQSAAEMIVDLEAMLAILRDKTATETVSYRGATSNRLEQFVLPSESTRSSRRQNRPSSKSSILSRFITRDGSKSAAAPTKIASPAPTEPHDDSATELMTPPATQAVADQPTKPASVPSQPRPVVEEDVREDVFSLKSGSVVFAWPSELAAGDVEAVEQWLNLVVAKMKQASVQDDSSSEQSDGVE